MTQDPDQHPDDERGGVDVEAAWAQIVAHWSDEAEGHDRPRDDVRVGGDQEIDLTDDRDVDGDASPQDASPQDASPQDASPQDASRDDAGTAAPQLADLADDAGDGRDGRDDRRPADDWRRSWGTPATSHVGGEHVRSGGSRSLDDPADEGGFVPPEPPPLPRGDLISTLAWVGALGAPLFLLLAALFWRTAPTALIGAAVAAFMAGFITLVVRMSDRSDDEDDGAVV